MNASKDLQNSISSLPQSPWVYKFLNSQRDILYIGKSKNLKARVSSYFVDGKNLNFAKKKMIEHITQIEYIITHNETESLILENTLIKEIQPKYNVLLKDDKNFLYIKITKDEFPKIIKSRIAPSDMRYKDATYFGPYVSGSHVQEILKIIKKVFGYGVGSHHFFHTKHAYNIDPYIFKWNIDASEEQQKILYHSKIDEIKKVLKWETKVLWEKLTQEMQTFADNLEFEEAQKRKISLQALESLSTLQIVRDGVRGEYMIVQLLEKYDALYVGITDIRSGKITWYENALIENKLQLQHREVLTNIIEQKWVENRHRPWLTFIVSEDVDIDHNIRYEVPKIWVKVDLLKLGYKNLYEYAHKKHLTSISSKNFTKKTMLSLLEKLGYTATQKDIVFECNDISHLSGTHSVASRSVIENGKRNPKKYKKFRIKTLNEWKIDDFAAMREIITRRLKEIEKLWNIPDLIVIDGGKWQLSVVMETIHSCNSLKDTPLQIVSLAKREEELYLPWNSKPIVLQKDSAELRLVQALRDEAHRFAIGFNRDSRSTAQKKNILESLPWIGPKTRKKILNTYGSVENLKNISQADLQKHLWTSITQILENHGLA